MQLKLILISFLCYVVTASWLCPRTMVRGGSSVAKRQTPLDIHTWSSLKATGNVLQRYVMSGTGRSFSDLGDIHHLPIYLPVDS